MPQSRPNILYIMSDDHSTNAVNCYGGWLNEVVDTPNLDRIAREGMRFEHCYCNNSLCSPSRASIIIDVTVPDFCDWQGYPEVGCDGKGV